MSDREKREIQITAKRISEIEASISGISNNTSKLTKETNSVVGGVIGLVVSLGVGLHTFRSLDPKFAKVFHASIKQLLEVVSPTIEKLSPDGREAFLKVVNTVCGSDAIPKRISERINKKAQ